MRSAALVKKERQPTKHEAKRRVIRHRYISLPNLDQPADVPMPRGHDNDADDARGRGRRFHGPIDHARG